MSKQTITNLDHKIINDLVEQLNKCFDRVEEVQEQLNAVIISPILILGDLTIGISIIIREWWRRSRLRQ